MDKPVLAPDFLWDLAASNPHGLVIGPEVVQSWFEMVWPRFQTYDYRSPRGVKRAIASWWSRVRVEEIRQAQERLKTRSEEVEDRRLQSLSRSANIQTDRPPRPPRRRFETHGVRSRG